MAVRIYKYRLRISRICFLAMMIGFVIRLTDYKFWFALSNYTIDAESPVLEKRLWQFFPEECIKFWPNFIKGSKNLSEFLERDLPVSERTEMHGLGNFTTHINWIEAWLTVEWRGEIWNISRDGKMWAINQEGISESKSGVIKNPIWKIPDEVFLSTSLFGVFKSPIATDVMGLFVDEFRGHDWFDTAENVTWGRRAGFDLFILRVTHGRQNFEILIQREKYAGQDLGAIVDNVYNKLLEEGGSHVIDLTYEGKIVLRKL